MNEYNAVGSDYDEDYLAGFFIGVKREEGKWVLTQLADSGLTSLEDAEQQLKNLRSIGAVFGMLAVDDGFFVIVRPTLKRPELFISDAAAALENSLAAQVLQKLNVEPPDLSLDELAEVPAWTEGNATILADLGLPAELLIAIALDEEMFPDEQLEEIAKNLGFENAYQKLLDRIYED